MRKWGHDLRNRLEREEVEVEAGFDRLETVTDRYGREIVYTYDANGNRTGLSAPNQQTSYTFDDLNRVATVTNGTGLTTYRYFQNSRLRDVSYPNGTKASYTYDSANRLASIENIQGLAEVSSYVYTYDDNSDRESQTAFQVGCGTEVTTYDYDASDRLDLVVYPEKTVTYAYDDAGIRIRRFTRIQRARGPIPLKLRWWRLATTP